MPKKISFSYSGKRFTISAKACNNFQKFLGLMFKKRENAEALLFEFKKPVNIKIHSCFVFFPFVAVWLDGKKVVEIKKIEPFTLSAYPKKPFNRLIEVPVNKKYTSKVELLVGD